MFLCFQGKTKVVTECRTGTTTQEPTPNFDCHTTKQVVDQSKNHIRAFQALQVCLYSFALLYMGERVYLASAVIIFYINVSCTRLRVHLL